MSHKRILIETSMNIGRTPAWVEHVARRFALPLIRLEKIFDPALTPPERVVAAQYGYKPGTVTMEPIHREHGGYFLLNWVDFFHKRRDIVMPDLVDMIFTREFREAYDPPEGKGRPHPAEAVPFDDKEWSRLRQFAGTLPIIGLPVEGTPEDIEQIMRGHLR